MPLIYVLQNKVSAWNLSSSTRVTRLYTLGCLPRVMLVYNAKDFDILGSLMANLF